MKESVYEYIMVGKSEPMNHHNEDDVVIGRSYDEAHTEQEKGIATFIYGVLLPATLALISLSAYLGYTNR